MVTVVKMAEVEREAAKVVGTEVVGMEVWREEGKETVVVVVITVGVVKVEVPAEAMMVVLSRKSYLSFRSPQYPLYYLW